PHVSIRIRSRRALVYRLADRVVTSGEAVRAIVVGAGVPAGRVVSIPPGVDTRRFHPGVSGKTVRDELGLAADQPLVGLVANIRGSKGHNVFLEAAREVLQWRPDARFLVGDARALAAAMLELVSDPARARALGRAGQQLAAECYSLDASMALTTSVYRGLLGQN